MPGIFLATSFSSKGLMPPGPGDLFETGLKGYLQFRVLRQVGIDKVTFCDLDHKVAGKQELDGNRVT